jgi:TPR repeat protein
MMERDHPDGAYAVYHVLHRDRLALQRDSIRALSGANDRALASRQREELASALAGLRAAALRGNFGAMHQLALYHRAGGLPDLRAAFAFRNTDHHLPLARFWFEQALKSSRTDLVAPRRSAITAVIAEIDQTLALAKGRKWTGPDILAALESGLPTNDLRWLLQREGGALTRAEQTRILNSPVAKKLNEYDPFLMALGTMVVTGPDDPARDLAAATITERRRTVSPMLPDPGTDLAALRRRFEAGDPAAAYALLILLPAQHPLGGWPEDAPPAARVREVAVSRDYAPAQYLRIDLEGLERRNEPAKLDLPRAFSLLLTSARAGSAEAARRVANYYCNYGTGNPVRPNLVEAEWWYAQAAALAWPDQFKGGLGLALAERNLSALYNFKLAGMVDILLDGRHPATHRWARELRRRGGPAQALADEQVAYFGTTDAGNHDLDKLIAALPAEFPPFAPAELARLERDASAGQPEALRTLARALAYGEGGLRQDDARAAALYRRAAEAGDREAMSALAEIYQNGYGVPLDLTDGLTWKARAEGQPVDRAAILIAASREAARTFDHYRFVEPYLREAIALGSAEAKNSLGSWLLGDGRVVKKDPVEGLRLLTEAAEAGVVGAMTSLGYYYREGKVVPADPAAAHRWRLRAAEAGDKNSINALAYDFEQGRNGAPQDAREALRWARLAAPHSASAARAITRLEREVAALDRNPGMTAAQLRSETTRNLAQLAQAYEAAAADPGVNAFTRAATLTGDARLAALREAARHNHIEATAQLMELLNEARLWHEAHWWATRSFMLERDDSAKARALIEGQSDFHVAKLTKDEVFTSTPVDFSAALDEPLEKSLPILAEALQRAGQDRHRLVAQLDQIIDRHADRAEPLIAKAQLTLDQPAAARELLDRAVKLAPAHPQAHALLARIEASAGQPYRAYYRLTEVRKARPESLMLAAAQAELLHALGGEAAERQKARHSVHYLLKRLPADYPPPDRFAALVAAAKLAAGMEAWAEAEADLSVALQLNPDPRLLLERAQVRERLQAYPGAIADYTAVLASPLGQNPQQAAQLRARLEAVQKTMNAETARLRDETAKIDAGL